MRRRIRKDDPVAESISSTQQVYKRVFGDMTTEGAALFVLFWDQEDFAGNCLFTFGIKTQ